MTFVEVKDNEWLDLENKILLAVEESALSKGGFDIYIRLLGQDKDRDVIFNFLTLEAAIEAQKRIIVSCLPRRSVDTKAGDTLDAILGIKPW